MDATDDRTEDPECAETGQPGCRVVVDAIGLAERDRGRRRFRGAGLSGRVRSGALEGGTPDGVLFGRLTARTRRAPAKGPDHAHPATAVRQRACGAPRPRPRTSQAD